MVALPLTQNGKLRLTEDGTHQNHSVGVGTRAFYLMAPRNPMSLLPTRRPTLNPCPIAMSQLLVACLLFFLCSSLT